MCFIYKIKYCFYSDTGININDDWRGTEHGKNFYNKDSFAIAYDRIVCLKDGEYVVYKQSYHGGGGDRDIQINGVATLRAYQLNAGTATISASVKLKRGDYLQTIGRQADMAYINWFYIEKK